MQMDPLNPFPCVAGNIKEGRKDAWGRWYNLLCFLIFKNLLHARTHAHTHTHALTHSLTHTHLSPTKHYLLCSQGKDTSNL